MYTSYIIFYCIERLIMFIFKHRCSWFTRQPYRMRHARTHTLCFLWAACRSAASNLLNQAIGPSMCWRTCNISSENPLPKRIVTQFTGVVLAANWENERGQREKNETAIFIHLRCSNGRSRGHNQRWPNRNAVHANEEPESVGTNCQFE